MKQKFLFIWLAMLLSACSGLPPAIEDPPAVDVPYIQASQNISYYMNAPVRWGGTIIDVENEQNFSLVQVMSYPLNSFGRPMLDDPYEGRFLIKSPEFLDPSVYTKGKEMTVAGAIAGDTERRVGKKILRLPVVNANVIHLWPDYYRNRYYYYGGFGYGYYPYSPYYWGGLYRPFPPY
ncbi:MAG: Slp family lipoprotein [Gammaproteobacteria bacterium]